MSNMKAVTFTPKVVVLKTVLDKDVETSVHKQEVNSSDMPYGHLITSTVMTLGVYQGHSSIVSFFLY